MNYYPHHIGDYMVATVHLSDFEDLAYRRMIEVYYLDERPFPDDPKWIAKRIRLIDREAEVCSILEQFFRLQKDGWHQKRCDLEMREFRARADRARKNGKKGGRPPSPRPAETLEEKPSGLVLGTQTKTNQNQNQNQNQKPEPKATPPTALRESVEETKPRGVGERGAPSENRSPPAARATRLSVDELPDEWRHECEAMRPDLDPSRTFEVFADHWRAKPGRDGCKVDWLATWRNWCRRESSGFAMRSQLPARRNGYASKAESIAEHNARLAAQLEAESGAIDVEAREITDRQEAIEWQPAKA